MGRLIEKLGFIHLFDSTVIAIGNLCRQWGDRIRNSVSISFAKLDDKNLKLTIPQEYKKALESEDVKIFLRELWNISDGGRFHPIFVFLQYMYENKNIFIFNFEYADTIEFTHNDGEVEYRKLRSPKLTSAWNWKKGEDKMKKICYINQDYNANFERLVKNFNHIRELFYTNSGIVDCNTADMRILKNLSTEIPLLKEKMDNVKNIPNPQMYMIEIQFNKTIFKAIIEKLRKEKLIDF